MFEREDLTLVPYRFTDLSAGERRPVLAGTGLDTCGDFIGLPVTLRARAQHALPLVQADKTHGILPLASWVRIDRIVTPSGSLVIKTVGHVADRVVTEAGARFYSRVRNWKP